MTTLVASSVVRGSRQGDSHGGVYLVDFAREEVRQALDWNSGDIDFQGRGWDRGLRGIAFDRDDVYIAASDELFVYGPDFRRRNSWRNRYLKHAHEIFRYGRTLFVTSTGFNCVLAFDLDRKAFNWGLAIDMEGGEYVSRTFDPNGPRGPRFRNIHHINNVWCDESGMYISGRNTRALLRYNGRDVAAVCSLPQGVHNARRYRDGVIFNDTESNVVRFASPTRDIVFKVPEFDPSELTHTDLDDSAIARQGFGRGLTVIDDGLLAAGSSPSTITLYDIDAGKALRSVTLTKDIRNSIHGLEPWPFETGQAA